MKIFKRYLLIAAIVQIVITVLLLFLFLEPINYQLLTVCVIISFAMFATTISAVIKLRRTAKKDSNE